MSTPLRERPDAPLGTLIFRAGLLPAETIESALEEGVKTGRRLGEILIERGLLEEEDLTRLLAGQKGLPFVTLRSEAIDPDATRLLSEDQARLFSALPIRFEEGLPLVAVADPTNDVLNRNIREALGQDVRFVVAGRTELDEVMGEAYSGTLRTVAPEPAAEPALEPESTVEAEFEPAEPAPLRVDTSESAAEEAPVPMFDPEPVTGAEATEPETQPEPQPEISPEPVPSFEAVDPEPAFEAPAYEPEPAVEPDPEPSLEPEPEPEPEPVFEAAATFEAPAPEAKPEPPAPTFDPPAAPTFDAPAAPTFDAPAAPEPVAPVAIEPAAPLALPESNGQVPHDLEAEVVPAASPKVPAAAPTPPAPPDMPAAANGTGFTVSVRLTSGERLTVAECEDIGEAKGYAKALTKQLGTTDPDEWPFVNGRFLKPDTILSVDVEQT
jgi:MshEN domain